MRRSFIMLLTAFGLALGLFAPIASAAPFGSVESVNSGGYGMWTPDPASKASTSYYRADVQPFSTSEAAEMQTYACVYPAGSRVAGTPITPEEQALYKNALTVAGRVAQWNGKDGDEQNEGSAQYRGNTSQERLKNFLTDFRSLLATGKVPDMNDESKDSFMDIYKKDGNSDEGKLEEAVAALANPKELANLVNPTGDPMLVNAKLPEGCALAPLAPSKIKFSDLWNNTGKFVTDVTFYLPQTFANSAYTQAAPWAFKFAFWTPHTERGDTIMNVATTCPPTSRPELKQKESCAGTTALGFNKQRATDINQQSTWYIRLGIFFQWFLSGLYFLILFGGALVYMFTTRAPASFNVIQIMPRLIGSAILTMFAPFLIGAIISFSNYFVLAIFGSAVDGTQARSVGAIHDIMLAITQYSSSGLFAADATAGISKYTATDDFALRLLNVVTGVVATFYFLVFFFAAVVRQLALIALVVTAPIASFCLITPAWTPKAGMWMRFFIAVVTIPVIMGLILRIGTGINPLMAGGAAGAGVNSGASGDVSFLSYLLGVAFLLAMLWAMARTAKIMWGFARGGPAAPGLTSKMMRGAGSMAGMAAMATGNPWAAAALKGFGGAASGIGGALGAAEGFSAKLVPEGRGMMAARGGGMPTMFDMLDKASAGMGVNHGQGLGIGSGSSGGHGGGMAGGLLGGGFGGGGGRLGGGGPLQQHFAEHLQKRMAANGMRRVSPYMVPRMMEQEEQYNQQRRIHNGRVAQINELRDAAFNQHLAGLGLDPSKLDAVQLAERRKAFLFDGTPALDANGNPMMHEITNPDGTKRMAPVMNRAYDETLRDHLQSSIGPSRDQFNSDAEYSEAVAAYQRDWKSKMTREMAEYGEEHDHLVKKGGSYYVESARAPARRRAEMEAALEKPISGAGFPPPAPAPAPMPTIPAPSGGSGGGGRSSSPNYAPPQPSNPAPALNEVVCDDCHTLHDGMGACPQCGSTASTLLTA